jgi:hypothetical protein
MTTGPGGDSLCMHCIKMFGELLAEQKESGRGWHFTAPIKYDKQHCSCCNELIPKNVWALIIIYTISHFDPRSRTFYNSDKMFERLCLRCLQDFNAQVKEEDYRKSSVKRLTALLKQENKSAV